MDTMKRHMDWWFKDLRVRKGQYIVGEPANTSLIIFTVSMILALVTYKGFWQIAFVLIAYAALTYWGVREMASGHSRFRKLLGIMGLAAVAGALLLRLGF